MALDRITNEAAGRIVADLADNGGGTYERGTHLPFSPTVGYAVGIGGIRLPEAEVTRDKALWALAAVGGEFDTSYVGTWLDSGWVYFDAVRYFGADRREDALAAGWKAGQAAIYSFADATAISTRGAQWDS